MQVLRYIEDRFESLSLRVKIELFLFPLTLVFLFTYFMYTQKEETLLNNETVKALDIENMKMQEDIVDILKEIEIFAKKNSIHLENISNANKSIKIEAYSNIKNRIEFLNFLENYNSFSKLKNFEIIEDKLIVEINFDKFYEKKKTDLSSSLNLFEEQKTISYRLEAIVGQRVYINGKWFKKSDKIGSFNVFRIDLNSVVLKNSYEMLELKLYKNEDI